MSDKMLIDVLHENFVCGNCGACCRHGGQIRITPSEAQEIADYLDIDMSSMELFPFTAHIDDPDYLYLEVCDPCFFWDKVERTCMINEVKPAACLDYPWKLFKENGCLLDDIMICPSVCSDLAAILARPVEE